MKKKNIIIHLIQILIIILFMCSIINKEFQNDTFFTIAIGERVLEYGIETEEKLVWHEELEYTNSRWLFDSIIAIINNYFGFLGIYIFVMIMTSIQGVLLYLIINKITHKKFLSFISTIVIMKLSSNVFAARSQLISFLIFIIEFYAIEKLLETNKKRYFSLLIILALLLVNIHASVFPMYFVLYLPYIAEYILSLLKLNTSDKLIIEKKNIKKLLIAFVIGFLVGFCTPKGLSPYTDMFKAMEGVSTTFIAELQSIDINQEFYFWVSLILCIAIITFTKTKIRVTDAFFILGFALMSLSTLRCVFFYYLISGICIIRLINDFIEYNKISLEFINKKIRIILVCMIYVYIILLSINSLFERLNDDYINTMEYPVNATEYILSNIDISNMKIFNHFNCGSYLELKGIKSFIDSRSGIFTEEFNPGTTILTDWLNVTSGAIHYDYLFEKYGITHALLYNKELISVYIANDENWNLIYQDDMFSLYEKIDK